MTTAPEDPPPADRASRRERAVARAREARRRLDDARPRVPAVDIGFEFVLRDSRVQGGVLSGALAFRFFLWLLPVVLLLVSALGFASASGAREPVDLARSFGITGVAAAQVADAAHQAESSRWVTLVIGVWLLLYASYSASRTIRAVHALAWRIPLTRTSPLRAALVFLGLTAGLVVTGGASARLREIDSLLGLIVTVASIAAVFGLALLGEWLLPHEEVPWTALVPGAALFAVGVEALHLVTVYWVPHQLDNASRLYGSLGAAVALLVWMYLAGRLVVGAAVLNATIWDWRGRRAAAAD